MAASSLPNVDFETVRACFISSSEVIKGNQLWLQFWGFILFYNIIALLASVFCFVVIGLVYLVLAKKLAGKNDFKITYSLVSGM